MRIPAYRYRANVGKYPKDTLRASSQTQLLLSSQLHRLLNRFSLETFVWSSVFDCETMGIFRGEAGTLNGSFVTSS